jgi:hypothetical protein
VERLQRARTLINVLYVTLASAGAIALDHKLSHDVKDWSTVIAALVISVVAIILAQTTEWLITGTGLRRFVLAADYIEGTWIDAYPANDMNKRHVAVLNIRLERDHYEIDGETYDPDTYIKKSSWSSTVCSYNNRRLDYLFQEEFTANPPTSLGAAHLDFVAIGGHPVRYNLTVMDSLHDEKLVGSGFKVENESHLNALKTGKGIPPILREYWELAVRPKDPTTPPPTPPTPAPTP